MFKNLVLLTDVLKIDRKVCSHVTAALLTEAERREPPKSPCDNMDEPGGHYAKSNKQDKEKQILHDVTSCKDGPLSPLKKKITRSIL